METGLKRAKEVLPSNEECWKAFFASGVTGIAIVNFSGHYVMTNATFRGMLGYREAEIHHMLLSDFTDDKNSHHNPFANLVNSGEGRVKIQMHYRRNDGSFIWLNASLFVVPGTQTTTRFLIALVEDISEAKRAQTQAVDDERRRLAEELHDNTGQNIVAMIMGLHRIKSDMETNPEAHIALSECAALAQQSLREIRTFSYLLHPPLFDELGFVAAMRTFAQIFAERSEMKVEVDLPDSYAGLPSEMEVTLFWVAQEGMINAHRYAVGSGVTIRMTVDGTVIRLCVESEGTLNPSPSGNDSGPLKVGVGISGIRERVQHFGGQLLLRSDQNRTFLEAVIPVPNVPKLFTEVENAMGHPRVATPGKELAEAEPYPEDKIGHKRGFGKIVGNSASLERVFKQIETVAPTDSSVLILGETGTGKELIATAIHGLSSRRDHRFVTSNCASIPAGLLESELFGHEKGAFNGAVTLKVGRVELANKGTLFLDEIGEIPLELQSKLLRVLQQREFERLGSNRVIHADFRLVTATNRDLIHMVEDCQFRSDLYYRLNVFPIEVPPLRDRPKDIPLLAWHFAKTYAQCVNKRIESIRSVDMESLIIFTGQAT